MEVERNGVRIKIEDGMLIINKEEDASFVTGFYILHYGDEKTLLQFFKDFP